MIQGFGHIEVEINVSVHIMKGCGVRYNSMLSYLSTKWR